MTNTFSTEDNKFKFEVVERDGLFRIQISFVGNSGEWTMACGSNSSVFDNFEDAKNEGMRFMDKYLEHPEWFK